RTGDDHLAFTMLVTVICPLMRSASNLTLSPTFTCLSIAGSCTRKTIVIPSFISIFLIGPCLSVILPAASSIFVTWPLTVGAWARVTLASIPPERTSMVAAMTLIFRMYRLILAPLISPLSGLARREMSVILMRRCQARHCDMRRQACCGRRQQKENGGDEAGKFRHGDFFNVPCGCFRA